MPTARARKPAIKIASARAAKPAIVPIRFATPRAWETWLRAHGASSDGVWMQIAKAGAAQPTVTYAQAIDGALCHGWIDGQKRALDDQHWLQRFTPRRPRSLWSKINCAKAIALIEGGRMLPAGQAQIDAARADGRWDAAYHGARTSMVPADLQAALDASLRAARFFATLDATNRYAVLWRVQTAVKPETRAKRIAQLVDMLARGEKLHP